MSNKTAKEILDDVEHFVKMNLGEFANERIELSMTSLLPDGVTRQARKMLEGRREFMFCEVALVDQIVQRACFEYVAKNWGK